ncbi:MAG: transcriptional repressor [gamma proteobacterium endosymbiont of Lamellibrachia anaximandri]|nr:transcriptional repressor [gamma proteobacterium endosymbiont of Lamellibrachia anaximandri]
MIEKAYRSSPPTTSSADVEQRLRAYGINPTQQRLTIAGKLFAKHQHVTADQVHESVKTGQGCASKATVYNTLGLFVEKGLLREIFVDSSRTFYDSNIQPHHHFYNVDTGDLIDAKEHLNPFFVESDLPHGTILEDVDIVIRVREKTAVSY